MCWPNSPAPVGELHKEAGDGDDVERAQKNECASDDDVEQLGDGLGFGWRVHVIW